MIYLFRAIHVTGTGLTVGSILALMALYGRRGNPLIDAPEYIPWTLAFFVLGIGLFMLGGALGSDLPPFDRRQARIRNAATQPGLNNTAQTSSERVAAHNSQVMTDYLNGKSDVDFDTFSDAVGGRLRPPPRTEDEVRRNAEVASLDLTASPVRLKVMVPPRPSDSWIGGNPSMPDGMAWPEVDGKPAMFYAQIAAHALPADLWGWQGPRSGWLLIFGPSDYTHGDAIVLHSEERGTERKRPVGQVFKYFRYGEYDKHAQLIMGDKGLQPPRWPVEILPTTETARPAEIKEGNAQSFFRINEEGWLPFDWETLQLLMAQLIHQIEFSIKARSQYGQSPQSEDIIASLDVHLPSLRQLEELVRVRSEQVPFSLAERDRILDVLKTLSYAEYVQRDGQQKRIKASLLGKLQNSDYAALHDARAKHVYVANPADLPSSVRDLLEPQWQAVADDEIVTMGTDSDRFEQYGVANIIELVPSRLFSWSFGDYSNFAVMLRVDDLLDGDWSKSFAMDNHGL